jgi:arginine deiminase
MMSPYLRAWSNAARRRTGVPAMGIVGTAGDGFETEREQWDDANNVVTLEPGAVVGYERNTGTKLHLYVRLSRGASD